MDKKKKTRIHWGRFAGWAILFLIAAWFLSKIASTLMLFALALFFTYLLYPLVKVVSNIQLPVIKKKIPWIPSIAIVYLFLTSVFIIGGLILAPAVTEQVNNIVHETPRIVAGARTTFDVWQNQYNKFDIPEEIRNRIGASINDLTSRAGALLENTFKAIGNFFISLFSWIVFIILALVFAFFILMDIDKLTKNAYQYIPPVYRKDVKELVKEINDIFGNYIRGNIICIIANGGLTYVSLILGLIILRHTVAPWFPLYQYALVTSVIAGVLFPIPYIAHAFSIIIAGILAYLQFQSIWYALAISMIVFLVFQFVDFVVRPKIMGDAMGVSTIFIFFACIAGGELMGGMGLLVGIPIAVMLISIVRYIYNRFLALPVSEVVSESADSVEIPLGRQKLSAVPGGDHGSPILVDNGGKLVAHVPMQELLGIDTPYKPGAGTSVGKSAKPQDSIVVKSLDSTEPGNGNGNGKAGVKVSEDSAKEPVKPEESFSSGIQPMAIDAAESVAQAFEPNPEKDGENAV